MTTELKVGEVDGLGRVFLGYVCSRDTRWYVGTGLWSPDRKEAKLLDPEAVIGPGERMSPVWSKPRTKPVDGDTIRLNEVMAACPASDPTPPAEVKVGDVVYLKCKVRSLPSANEVVVSMPDADYWMFAVQRENVLAALPTAHKTTSIDYAMAARDKAEKECAAAKQAIAAAHEAISESSAELRAVRAEIHGLQSELAAATVRFAGVEKERDEAVSERDAARNKLVGVEGERDELKAKLAAVEAERAHHKSCAASVVAELRQLERESRARAEYYRKIVVRSVGYTEKTAEAGKNEALMMADIIAGRVRAIEAGDPVAGEAESSARHEGFTKSLAAELRQLELDVWKREKKWDEGARAAVGDLHDIVETRRHEAREIASIIARRILAIELGSPSAVEPPAVDYKAVVDALESELEESSSQLTAGVRTRAELVEELSAKMHRWGSETWLARLRELVEGAKRKAEVRS